MTFEEILQQSKIPYITEGHHHCRAGWVQFDCPYCGKGSQKWHMGYSLTSGACNCWRCGPKGSLKVLITLTGRPYGELRDALDHPRRLPQREKKLGVYKQPSGVGRLKAIHREYLRNRGFRTGELARLWSVAGIANAPKLRWRLFIPIYYEGQPVSWTTRALNDRKSGKYINATADEEAIPAKSLLYGEDYARDTIIICEGPTDVWRIGPGAVAVMGLNYSEAQVLKMSKFKKRLICFDSEDQAQRRAMKLLNELALFPGDTYNTRLPEGDPGSADFQTIRELRRFFT